MKGMEFIIESIKKQGFNVMVLCGVIYWFNLKYDKLEAKYDLLNSYVRDEFKNVIEKNTAAYIEFINRQK